MLKPLLLLVLVIDAVFSSKQNLLVVWHDGEFQSYEGPKDLAFKKYYSVEEQYAKCIVNQKEVLELFGGDYRVIVVGYAIEQGFLRPATRLPFFIAWHDGHGRTIEGIEESQAIQIYEKIGPSFAKAILKNGKVLYAYGGDYKYYAIGLAAAN